MISHASGPGCIAILANISIGVAGGKRETAFEKVLEGESKIGPKHIIGMITSSITGVIKLWASRISLQAAPMAEKIEPKITRAMNKKKTNQA